MHPLSLPRVQSGNPRKPVEQSSGAQAIPPDAKISVWHREVGFGWSSYSAGGNLRCIAVVDNEQAARKAINRETTIGEYLIVRGSKAPELASSIVGCVRKGC